MILKSTMYTIGILKNIVCFKKKLGGVVALGEINYA